MAVVGILVLGLAVRLVNLNQSLWLDEAVSVLTARDLGLAGLLAHYRSAHFQPPLHSVVLWFWGRVFGWSEVSMRLPSVLAGVGTVWAGYRLALILGGKRVARRAALFLSLSPFLVYYSQEARPYSLSVFFAVWWLVAFAGWRHRKTGWLGFVLTGAMAVWSGYYTFLLIPVQWLIAGKDKVFFKKLIRAQVGVLALFLPWLPTLFVQLRAGVEGAARLTGWSEMVNLSVVKILPVTLVKFYLGRITFFDKTVYGLVSMALFGLTLILIRQARRSRLRKLFRFSLVWLGVPLGLVWLGSLVVPNYQPFRVLLVLPAVYLMAAAASGRSKLLFILILAMSLYGLGRYWGEPFFWREDWRGLGDWAKDRQLVIVLPSAASAWPLQYYNAEVIAVGKGDAQISAIELEEAEPELTARQQLVYVPYLEPVFDPEGQLACSLQEAGFTAVDELAFNQLPVVVYRKEE